MKNTFTSEVKIRNTMVDTFIHRQNVALISSKIAAKMPLPHMAYPAPFCVRLTDGEEKWPEDVKKVVETDIAILCDKSKIDVKCCNGVPEIISFLIKDNNASLYGDFIV